jgi:hypothetical protein
VCAADHGGRGNDAMLPEVWPVSGNRKEKIKKKGNFATWAIAGA